MGRKSSARELKAEVDRILPTFSEHYASLDEEEREIVDIIVSPKKYLYGERSDAVLRQMDAQAGCSLYVGTHVDKLCDIIKKLAIK